MSPTQKKTIPTAQAVPVAENPPQEGDASMAIIAIPPANAPPVDLLTTEQLSANSLAKLLAAQKTISGIRVSVDAAVYWPLLRFPTDSRLTGTMERWTNKANYTVKITWDDGFAIEDLHDMLRPAVKAKLESYNDGRSAPRHRGIDREDEERAEEAQAPRRLVHIPYDADGTNPPGVQVWEHVHPLAIDKDWRQEPRRTTTLKCQASHTSSVLKMFVNCTFPTALLDGMLKFFNQRLCGTTSSDDDRKTTKGEIYRFLGYMLAICLHPTEAVDEMWRRVVKQRELAAPPDLGKHGLTKNRFRKLRTLAGELWDVDDKMAIDDPDPWRFSTFPEKCFNAHMSEVVNPGTDIGPDEGMSFWTGREGGGSVTSIPHSSFVPRKPKSRGGEMKMLAEADMELVIAIEVQQGAKYHHALKWADQWPHATAQCLRLALPWLRSFRTFGGDSWFMSWLTCQALLANGLYPFGDVKTQSSHFPVLAIQQDTAEPPGSWAVMTSTIEIGGGHTHEIYFLTHRRGGSLHTYVSTHGLTTAGKPQRHYEDAETTPRKCPEILNLWTKMQPVIDKSNRWRQRILAIEERFTTESWPFRYFTSVLGICFVNTFSANKYSNRDERDFKDVLGELAYDLMHNEIDGLADTSRAARGNQGASSRPPSPGFRPPSPSASSTGVPVDAELLQHFVVPLRSIPGYSGGPSQNCSVPGCGKTTRYCCVCSTANDIFACHPPSNKHKGTVTERGCLDAHVANLEVGSRRHPCGRYGKRSRKEGEDDGPNDDAEREDWGH